MVQPTSASSAQQAYLSPLPKKNDDQNGFRAIDKPEAEKYQSGVSDKPPVENVEQAAKQKIDNTNIKLATQEPQQGTAENETTKRGSLIDVFA